MKNIKKKINDAYRNVKFTEDQKICSFFKNTLLPRKRAVKFTFVLNNSKKDYIGIQAAKKFLSPHNEYVLNILVRGFVLFYIALLSIYYDIEDYQKVEDREVLSSSFYNLTILNTFVKMFFNEYYFNNENMKIFSIGYLYDKMYYDTFINYFNLYLFLI